MPCILHTFDRVLRNSCLRMRTRLIKPYGGACPVTRPQIYRDEHATMQQNLILFKTQVSRLIVITVVVLMTCFQSMSSGRLDTLYNSVWLSFCTSTLATDDFLSANLLLRCAFSLSLPPPDIVVVTPTLLNPSISANSALYSFALTLLPDLSLIWLSPDGRNVESSSKEPSTRLLAKLRTFLNRGRSVAIFIAVMAMAGSTMDHFTRLMPSQE